ncbi:MAG: polysaccharide biosynthesis C-terminal domain-containing protein [Saprospiraceae bacterium]|nr:polysaccharide biosynthesis C-terminal domain-containing protein [Candidatus Vicinibacter affinis]
MAIGIFSTLFIYPKNLELYGLYGFLTNTASLFTPFITLGFGAVLIRYSPFFNQTRDQKSGFFYFILGGYMLGMMIFVLLFLIIKPWYISQVVDPAGTIANYVIFLLPLTLLYVLFDLMGICSVNKKQIAIPALLQNLMKIILPLIFILCIKEYLTVSQFILCILVYYFGITLFIFFKLRKQNSGFFSFNLEIFKTPLRREMFNFALFNIIGGVSAVLALRIDTLMISSFLNAEETGKFVLASFICNAVYIPALSLTEILNPFISEASKADDHSVLKQYYKKSVINMLIPTLWLGVCLWACMDDLTSIMPNPQKMQGIKYCVGLLLLARVVDASTGINHHIFNYSKHYRLETILLIILATMNIGFNFFFIPTFGILGAAMGTLISVSIYNISKSIMIIHFLKLNPFDLQWLKIILFGLIITIFVSVIDWHMSAYFSILAKSISISILFTWGIWQFNLSWELRDLAHRIIAKFLS